MTTTWLDAFERIITILRGPRLTVEEMDAKNKTRIIITFCVILLTIVGAFVMNTTSVEQPMKDIAPSDKINYETLKLIVVQIFSVLTLLLGAKAMTSTTGTPPAPVQVTNTITTEANANDDQPKGTTP